MATITITPGNSFTATETVTSTKLNDLGSPTAALTAASIGTADIADDAITPALIADDAVTTPAILDANVTFAKLTDVIDDDTMATATDTTLATSESIKAYVDASGIVQRARVSSTTQHVTTATMTFDNTIPLVTEGLEILTTSYTPASSSNKISVSFNGQLSNGNSSTYIMVALFEDTVCVGACYFQMSSNGIGRTSAEFEFTPAGASAATYSIRVGSSSGTMYVNRILSSTATLGGLVETSMKIEEYAS